MFLECGRKPSRTDRQSLCQCPVPPPPVGLRDGKRPHTGPCHGLHSTATNGSHVHPSLCNTFYKNITLPDPPLSLAVPVDTSHYRALHLKEDKMAFQICSCHRMPAPWDRGRVAVSTSIPGAFFSSSYGESQRSQALRGEAKEQTL